MTRTPRLTWLFIVFTFLDTVLLLFSKSTFLPNYLLFSPLDVFKQLYPHFWWLVFAVVKFHLPVLWLVVAVLLVKHRNTLLAAFDKGYAVLLNHIDNATESVDGTLFYMPAKIEKRMLLFLFVLAFAVRTVFMLMSDNFFNGDSGARLYMSYIWSVQPTFFMGFDWLPLHFYLMGAAIRLTGDVVWAPRMVGVLLGALTIIPFYYLVKRYFGIFIAVLSAVLFVMKPMHINLSVVTLSEVPFAFFIISAAALFAAFDQNPEKRGKLYMSALFLACACFIRFEGWLYCALFFAVLLYKRESFSTLMRYGLLLAVAPCIVLVYSWLGTGDPFRGVSFSDYEVRQWAYYHHVSNLDNLKSVPKAFSGLALLFIPVGIILTANRKRLFYLLILIAPLLIVLYKMYMLSLTGQTRYLLLASILARPFYLVALTWIVSVFVRRNVVKYAFVFGCGVWSLAYSYRIHLKEPLVETQQANYPKGFLESALWVRDSLPCGSRLYVGNKQALAPAWFVYSNSCKSEDYEFNGELCTGERRIEAEKTFLPENEVTGWASLSVELGEGWRKEHLLQALEADRVDYLVVFKNGAMDSILNFEDKVEDFEGYRFIKKVDFDGNKIYAFSGPIPAVIF